jgi:hypothetical protein
MGRAQITVELIFQYSNYFQTLKYKTKSILIFEKIQTWYGGRVEHYEQLFSLGRLPIPNRIQVTNFWNKFEFESSLNFKGIQTFL